LAFGGGIIIENVFEDDLKGRLSGLK